MYVKNSFVRAMALCGVVLFVVVSCKKKRVFKEENGQAADDVRTVQAQNDEVAKDVNVAIMEQSLLRGKSASPSTESAFKTELCGVVIDTLSMYSGITRLNYSGTSCNGLTKSGLITVSIVNYPLSKWKHKGCSLKIEFQTYKVILPNGKTVQYDGTAYLKNESGNTWYDMRYLNATNLVQSQTASTLKITFDGSSTAIFNVNRKLTYNYANTITSCKVEGLGAVDGQTSLDNWGQNRDGNNFTAALTTPLVWTSSCGSISALEGVMKVKVAEKTYDLNCEFGVDQSGDRVSGDIACPYGWKMAWSYKRKTNTRVLAY